MFDAKILADSISPRGQRITTMEATYPRIIHAEFMTHRMFSRNAASSRAIPVERLIQRVLDDPFIPAYWGQNQAGMQAQQEIDPTAKVFAEEQWLWARDQAVKAARMLSGELNVHKQIANRLLEPFQWYTVIVTATEWTNFFGLRCHPDAQPEIQAIAYKMREAMEHSIPQEVSFGGWHLPLVPDICTLTADDFTIEDIKKISAGRCARVSYLTHHGQRDPHADIELCDRLVLSGHMSPLEHVSTPARDGDLDTGNFRGWKQFRKYVLHESDFSQR